MVYLYVGQFLSKQRTAAAVAEMFGTPVSSGTVADVTGRAAGRLGEFLDRVRDRLAGSEVVGFDETGLRVEGKLHWVHCARTGKYTLVGCHARRGRDGIDALGVLPRFRGIAVHDAWAPYDTYPEVEHQLCCAHVLRELQGVAVCAPAGEWCWANQAADALTAMQKLVAEAMEAGHEAVDPAALDAQVCNYRSAALIGINETAARSGKLMKKHNALAHRLIDRQDDYLRFTRDWRVTADNNGSEVRHEVARDEWTRRKEGRRVGSVVPGLCSWPVPTRTCVAGNGGVRSSGETPKGSRAIRGATGKGKTGRVNTREPSMMPRYVEPLWMERSGGVQDWPLRSGRRRPEIRRRSCEHRRPGVERAPIPVVSHTCGTWEPRPDPDLVQVRSADREEGSTSGREQDDSGSERRWVERPRETGTAVSAPPLADPDNRPDTGPGARTRKGAHMSRVSLRRDR